jgi:mono/diheme cytochrome c family protein
VDVRADAAVRHQASEQTRRSCRWRVSTVDAAAIFAAALYLSSATAADTPNVTPEQAKQGAALYAQHCAPCHGHQMKDPEGALDLRKFPLDQHARFVTSVTNGKGAMPPWRDLLKPDEIQALWAYVNLGEKK